jgi:hypothetical protein
VLASVGRIETFSMIPPLPPSFPSLIFLSRRIKSVTPGSSVPSRRVGGVTHNVLYES